MRIITLLILFLFLYGCGVGVDHKYKKGQSCTFLGQRVVVMDTWRLRHDYIVVFGSGVTATVPENQLSNCYY